MFFIPQVEENLGPQLNPKQARRLCTSRGSRRRFFAIQWDEPSHADHNVWYIARVRSLTSPCCSSRQGLRRPDVSHPGAAVPAIFHAALSVKSFRVLFLRSDLILGPFLMSGVGANAGRDTGGLVPAGL